MSDSPKDIGMYDTATNEWIAFEGARLAKPSPYFTDGNPDAYRQWLAQSRQDKAVVMRRATKAQMEAMRCG